MADLEKQRICFKFCFIPEKLASKTQEMFAEHFVMMPCVEHKPLNCTRVLKAVTLQLKILIVISPIIKSD
jgi:hypothetical protein